MKLPPAQPASPHNFCPQAGCAMLVQRHIHGRLAEVVQLCMQRPTEPDAVRSSAGERGAGEEGLLTRTAEVQALLEGQRPHDVVAAVVDQHPLPGATVQPQELACSRDLRKSNPTFQIRMR